MPEIKRMPEYERAGLSPLAKKLQKDSAYAFALPPTATQEVSRQSAKTTGYISAVLAAQELFPAEGVNRTLKRIAMEHVFQAAALRANEPFENQDIYYLDGTPQTKNEGGELIFTSPEAEIAYKNAVKAPGAINLEFLPALVKAAGIEEFDKERIENLLSRITIYDVFPITARQLRVSSEILSAAEKASPEYIKTQLPSFISDDKKRKWEYDLVNELEPAIPGAKPLTPKEQEVISLAVRLANATWQAGQWHRARIEQSKNRITVDIPKYNIRIEDQPGRGVFLPYDDVVSINNTQWAKKEGEVVAFIGTTFIETYKDIMQYKDALAHQYMLFGPFKSDTYPSGAQKKILMEFGVEGNAQAIKERRGMWEKYSAIENVVKNSANNDILIGTNREGQIIPGVLYGFFLNSDNNLPFAKMQLEQRPLKGLGIHLEEITYSTRDLLFRKDGSPRFSSHIISPHHAALLTSVVAPVHDLLKFLSSPNAQVMPDHEVMTASLVRRTFLDKQVMLMGQEQPYRLTLNDVDFIAGVIGDHENIEKPNEANRSKYIVGNEIQRAKALFFVNDVLTGALVQDKKEDSFFVDVKQLKVRFTDLYERHMAVDGGMSGEFGKIFRPEWGAHAINDLVSTLATLEHSSLRILPDAADRTAGQILITAALEGIYNVQVANAQRIEPKFSQEQLNAIIKAREDLQAIYKTIETQKIEQSPFGLNMHHALSSKKVHNVAAVVAEANAQEISKALEIKNVDETRHYLQDIGTRYGKRIQTNNSKYIDAIRAQMITDSLPELMRKAGYREMDDSRIKQILSQATFHDVYTAAARQLDGEMKLTPGEIQQQVQRGFYGLKNIILPQDLETENDLTSRESQVISAASALFQHLWLIDALVVEQRKLSSAFRPLVELKQKIYIPHDPAIFNENMVLPFALLEMWPNILSYKENHVDTRGSSRRQNR